MLLSCDVCVCDHVCVFTCVDVWSCYEAERARAITRPPCTGRPLLSGWAVWPSEEQQERKRQSVRKHLSCCRR